MERLLRLFLLCTFFESTTLASESEFYDIVLHTTRSVLRANLEYALHVASLSSDQPPRDLKLLFVLNLDVKATCVLHCILVINLVIYAYVGGVILSRLKLRTWTKLLRVSVWEIEHVLSAK